MTKKWGPYLIMLAAALWAVDALFRVYLTNSIPTAAIIFYEHVIGFIILSPFFIRAIPAYKKLEKQEWILLGGITIVSSVAGTLLFTEAIARSFEVFDFASPILLQKLQPLVVIGLAALFLKERITLRFLGLVVMALIGSYLINFGSDPISLALEGKTTIYLLSIGAAICWGTGTVMSRKLLTKLHFSDATAMRFLLAIPVSLIVMLSLNQGYSVGALETGHLWRLLVIAFTTGAGAVFIYYKGLEHTEAKIATMAELTLPVAAILIAITALNPYGEAQVLSLANVFGIVLTIIAILIVSFDYHKPPDTETITESI